MQPADATPYSKCKVLYTGKILINFERERQRNRENGVNVYHSVFVDVINTSGVSSSLSLCFSFTTAHTRLAGPLGSGDSLVFVSLFGLGLQVKVTMSKLYMVLRIQT